MPGESLSSWRQRGGLANGHRMFPLMQGELRRTDHDVVSDPGVLDWLAWSFDVDLEVVQALTLNDLAASALGPVGGRTHPEWLLRSRYSEAESAFGPSFCPQCIDGDRHGQPYFRRHWRLGFLTECSLHGCRLLDRCGACGSGVWPSWSTRLKPEQWPECLGICFRCHSPLGGSIAHPDDSPLSGRFMECVEAGFATLADGLTVPSDEYFRGLSVMAHLFLRGRSNRRIVQSIPSLRDVAIAFNGPTAPRRLLDLDVDQRRPLICAAAQLFEQWPSSFLEFCGAAGLTAEHLSPDRRRLPDWFEAVVVENLCRQRRGVTDADVQHAASRLRAQGLSVTRAELCRQFRSEADAIRRFPLRRDTASWEELARVLDVVEARLRSPFSRSSSYEAALRNACVLMISLLTDRDVSAVTRLTSHQVEALAESLPSHHATLIACGQRLRAWMDEYRAIRASKPLPGEKFFHPVHGHGDSVRATGRFYSQVLGSVDPLLNRSAAVFRSLLNVVDPQQEPLWN